MKEYIVPQKLIASNGALCENLLKKQTLQIGTGEKYTTVFNEGEFVILDFGKEMCGGIRILAFRADKTKVRLRFGESLTECCSELGGEKNATNDHSLRDFCVELQNFSNMAFGNTGFRFLRIDFYQAAELKSVVAENHILQKTVKYCYLGKDEQIRKIYETAKRTVDLCASSGMVWDGIKRDRLVWIGDVHPEMLALTTLYEGVPAIERSLEFVKKQTPLPEWMNWYPMYSMWWIIIVADYLERTGAACFASRQIEYVSGLMDLMLQYVSTDGEMSYPLNFVDWPTSGQPDELHGVRAINIIATKKAIGLLKRFGKKYENAEELLGRLMKKEMKVEKSKSVLGLKYFAVGLDEEDKEKLVKGGAQGMTTFMSYYILTAVASFDKQKAVEMMKEYYGGMLNKGATTFWEDFDLSWTENSCRIDEFPTEGQKDIHGDFGAYCYQGFRHSLCHGWSAGVIAFIKEQESTMV